MNLRKTRKGGAVLTRLKKPFYGSKNPKFALPISESKEINKDKYNILGKVSYNISGSDFAFFRTNEYVEKYLKAYIVDMAKKRFPSGVKIMEYEFNIESVVVGEQSVTIYDKNDGSMLKTYRNPITASKYFVSGTVVGLARPQNNNITRSKPKSK
jgi:hypothetical protein